MIERLHSWIIITYSIAIAGTIILTYTKYLDSNFSTFAILAVTLIVLIIYTYETYRIAETNLIEASPTISYSIVSGKKYYGIKNDSPDRRLYETRVITKNLSRFSTVVYINTNLRANGKIVDVGWHDYCGRMPRPLAPIQEINGWFNLEDRLKEVGISMDELAENHNSKLTMSLDIYNVGFLGYKIKYPVQNWKFDFSTHQWWNEDMGYSA
ncbi:MAG: hypothetical protein AABX40_00640 [Candidatus Hydrothermarchaeota archaeon]